METLGHEGIGHTRILNPCPIICEPEDYKEEHMPDDKKSSLSVLDTIADLLCEGNINAPEFMGNVFMMLSEHGLVKMNDNGSGFRRIVPMDLHNEIPSNDKTQIELSIYSMNGQCLSRYILDGYSGGARLNIGQDRSTELQVTWRGILGE